VVGALDRDQSSAEDAGAAFVFEQIDGAFAFRAELKADVPAAGDKFGSSLALLGDTLVIGALRRDAPGQEDAGAVFLFERDGTSYGLRQVLVESQPQAGALFGASLALAYVADLAQRLVVAAPGRDLAGQKAAGWVQVFRDGGSGSFAPAQTLQASEASAGAAFGASLAQDRSWLLVGCQGDYRRLPPELFRDSGEQLASHSLLLVPSQAMVAANSGPLALATGQALWGAQAQLALADDESASVQQVQQPASSVFAFGLDAEAIP
jgi:hypothetical protein